MLPFPVICLKATISSSGRNSGHMFVSIMCQLLRKVLGIEAPDVLMKKNWCLLPAMENNPQE